MPGKTNVLADALSRIYSDEPKGTVRTTSEFVSAEEEHLPSELLLNLVTTPLYTGTPMFLGATRRQSSAQQAFPNAKKVILKLPEVTARSLEGEGTKEVSLTEDNEPTTDEPISGTSTEPDTSDSAEDDPKDEEPIMLPDLVTLSEPELNICEDLRNQYNEDKFFSEIVRQPKNYKNFDVDNGLVYLKDNG